MQARELLDEGEGRGDHGLSSEGTKSAPLHLLHLLNTYLRSDNGSHDREDPAEPPVAAADASRNGREEDVAKHTRVGDELGALSEIGEEQARVYPRNEAEANGEGAELREAEDEKGQLCRPRCIRRRSLGEQGFNSGDGKQNSCQQVEVLGANKEHDGARGVEGCKRRDE